LSDYVLELNNITKIFPGVKALDNVHFQLKRGEIHALMGENGAGKSTFIKVITGVHAPDGGEILLDGQKVTFKNPKEASKASIAAIYQHGTCYPFLSITENIFTGHEIYKKGVKLLDWATMNAKAKGLLQGLGSDLNPKTLMGDLTVAERQIVEIAKAISTNSKIIIMDEPTAALSNRESEDLYRITLKLRDEGASIIFISHRFEDMYRLADRVTVFRDSKYIGTWGVNDISNDQLIAAMVGREISQVYPTVKAKKGAEVLRVEHFGRTGYFKDINFSVRAGEIFALTGLVGAGRTEVCQSIFGVEKHTAGDVYFNGQKANIKCPLDAMKIGIGYLPEDRQKQGLMLDWEIYKNETISNLGLYLKGGLISEAKEVEAAKRLSEKVSVKATSVYDKASSLSGGNQQKVIVAKLLTSDLKLIIMDEPTKGVDVGAKSQIYEIMSELAEQGYAIIMVSSELPEVLGMADRIAVMCGGRLTKILDNNESVTQQEVLKWAMPQSNNEKKEAAEA